uniref:NADH-ubiquinone oxidoreductase chain 4 n=1 Tax=Strongyloides venezuelensis TaxID=75913 RepID=A0A0P0YK27_STRVS|nr:NADH dehydrogenase subunit 4 [Strongyloides venezuelensis]BAT21216.1 NADH dehydrogenase subunit 4 [Strongyloides venezuelensis]
MVEFLLFSLLFFKDFHLFFLFLTLFCFCALNVQSWHGLFFFIDSQVYVAMMLMSMFIMGLILFKEKSRGMLYLSQVLVFISILFFIPGNVLMFYVLFELSMFPILIMILGYGYQIEKLNSFYYLLLYASLCSFPFLFVFLNLDFSFMLVYFDMVVSWEVVFILSLTFMMKFPVFFLHLWLPKAHVEAPTTASMLLAGLLLKLGTIGFVRIMKCLSYCHLNFYFFIAFLGMILAAFSCIFQSDVKALAAYSSITHMSFVMCSLLFMSISGKTASLLLMLAHGYTSTLMFYFIGEFYSVANTRMVYYFNSFMNSSLFFSIIFAICMLSNCGTPPSMSFIAEFMTFSNMYLLYSFFVLVFFIYFMATFYYSVYLIVNSFMGKNFYFLFSWNVYFTFPLLVMCFNVFWFVLLF